MDFNKHSDLSGQHAFLSPSKYHWINYDDQKLAAAFMASMGSRRGVELHAFANMAIRLGQRLPATRKALNMYVNDAIGYRMKTEQILFYSPNAFGTCDAIGFRSATSRRPRAKLRIHDLKTGITHTSEHQLEVYAALFCLEYRYDPYDIDIELRIYQRDEVRIYEGDPNVIRVIMDKIVMFDRQLSEIRLEVL